MMNRGKNKQLVIAVTLACLGVPSWAGAYTTDYVYHNGKEFAELMILNQGDTFIKVGNESVAGPAKYTLSPLMKAAVKSGTAYWAGILGPYLKTSQPAQIVLTTDAEPNASAITVSLLHKKGTEPEVAVENYVAQGLQGKMIRADAKEFDKKLLDADDGMYAFSKVTVGQHAGANRDGANAGWWVDTDTVLPANEQAADFVGTIRHELGHALGIMGKFQKFDSKTKTWNSSVNTPMYTSKLEFISRFDDRAKDRDDWNMHLIDQNGKAAKPGMVISTTASIKETLAAVPGLTENDLFIVDNGVSNPNLSGRKGYAFFVGDHVTEALDGATFYGVSGLPVNAWESFLFYGFEGSHLQTSGMMSHRAYSNYTSFMEAELAVMQDLGYDLDRKAYFGYSVYGDGGVIDNTHGYSARNAAGTAYTGGYSNVPLGIGLHIYGSRNTVTQSADILTHGTGATGIRVDGSENTLVIPKSTEIHADGQQGNGVLIAYGRGQTVKQSGTVTAKGQDGTGIRFDFGSSTNGAADEYRGSYIRYKRTVDAPTGKISSAENLPLTEMNKFEYNSTADELQGAMVDRYDLSGTLAGGKNAIYIGKNALVKNINVQAGAKIKGNITSDWKHFDTDGSYDAVAVVEKEAKGEALNLQYKGMKYNYNEYIPDLVTKLNFSGEHDYTGNINGKDNIKLNVTAGTLRYGGKADVVSVTVDKDATLLDGNYTVNKMTNIASGFRDDTTGKVINHGTLGVSSPNGCVEIAGDLKADGTLRGMAGGSDGQIRVSGTAAIDGATLLAANILPYENFSVLAVKNGNIQGSPQNATGTPYKTGLANITASVAGKEIKVTSEAANNLGKVDAVQQETYEAMESMRQDLAGDERLSQLRPLYSLEPEKAKGALSAIGSSGATQLAALAQQSTVSGRVISDRLSTAFSLQPVALTIPASKLRDSGQEDEAGLRLTTQLPAIQDNNAWVKFTKNWGDLRGGASYHGSAVSGGYDRAFGKNYRGGVFVSYNAISLGADSSGGNAYDTRVGLYGGYHKEARDAYIYLDYGIVRNKLHRGIPALGLNAAADYNSHIIELGGEYKYDLQSESGRVWHVSPYMGFQLSHMRQGAYREKGAGIFNQQAAGNGNTYFAGTCGVEFKRYLDKGNYGIRLGVRQAFAGANPELDFRYEGYDGRRYALRNNQDKTHFELALSGEAEFAPDWILAGDAGFLRGSHDKDISCALTLRRVW